MESVVDWRRYYEGGGKEYSLLENVADVDAEVLDLDSLDDEGRSSDGI